MDKRDGEMIGSAGTGEDGSGWKRQGHDGDKRWEEDNVGSWEG